MSWDDIHAGARYIREQTALAHQYQEETRRLNEETSALNRAWERLDMASSRLGAVETIVKKAFPNHPYFTQIEAIRQAGRVAGAVRKNTDDSYAAGANFPLPPYKAPNPEADRLRAENQKIRMEMMEMARKLTAVTGECGRLRGLLDATESKTQEIKTSLVQLQKDCVHHVALHYAFREELARVAPLHELVVSVARREELAKASYEAFVVKRDWDAVKRVGREFLGQTRADKGREYKDGLEVIFEGELPVEAPFANPHAAQQSSSPETLITLAAATAATQRAVTAAVAEVEDKAIEALSKMEEETKRIERDCVMHIALESAFRQELARVAPSHQLIVDQDKRTNLAFAAYEVFERSKSWADVKRFGREYMEASQGER